MTSPTQPTPEEIAAAESLVESVVCANSGGENEYERLPTILELALRLRALRAGWVKKDADRAALVLSAVTEELSVSRLAIDMTVPWERAMLEDNAAIRSDLAAATAREENLNIQLAACMTASVQNTETSRKDRIGRDNPYWCQAYEDVCRGVDREMRERARAEKAEELRFGADADRRQLRCEKNAQAEEIKRLRADKARIDFLKEHTHFEFWVHHPDYDVHGGKRFNAEGIVFREVLDSAINWLSAAPVVAKEGK